MKHLIPLSSRLLTVLAGTLILAASAINASAAAPEIVVEQPAGTDVSDGDSQSFGSVNVGSSATLTFTIKNTGDADLTGLAITKSGTHSGDFTVTGPAATSITGPSGSTTFTIQFAPTAGGSRTAAIAIASNDANESPFNINLSGTGLAPEIAVEDNASANIADGGSKSFGSVNVGSSSSLTFTIKNTGNANLTGLAITKDGAHEADFSITASPTAPVSGPSGSTTFTVQFTPSARGPRSAAIHIASNDPNENPFDINLTGTGLSPDIAVEVPAGTPITPTTVGGASLGSVTVNKVASITFNISNPGNSNLTLADVSLVSGSSPAVTIKSNITSTTVTPAGTSQFTLQFAPTSTGTFTGSVSIPTNVTGKNPYVISFTGTGVAAIPNTDDFGYSMDVAAPATANAYLKSTDPDVLIPGGLLVDDASLLVDIGFSFKFYDKAYTKCYISTNGLISFDEGVTAWSPTAIPSNSLPDNYIAPFWSDLKPGPDGGAILYATRGTAPNRTFIIKWEEMPEYYTPSRKVTFQLTLREGSNSIEVQYKDITAGFGDTRTYVGMGIESRNYGSTQPQPASNVIGLKAAHGLVDSANKEIDGNPIKSFPYAIRYTRPVVFTVESSYQKPTPTVSDPTATTTVPTPLTGPGDVSIFPVVKTHYKTPIGTNQRFEAPEVIYLDKEFNKLSSPGSLDGDPTKIAWYRLVNDGYAIDGQVVQGTHAFFSTTLNHDITVVWRWRLEYAAIIESGKPNGGAVNDGGRQWFKPGEQFTAIIDSPLDGISESSGMRLIVQAYSMFDRNGAQIGSEVPVTPGGYVSSNPFSMTQPVRLRWRWTGQVRYRFGAVNGTNPLLGQSFVRIYDAATPTILQASTPLSPNPRMGNSPVTEIWVDVGRKVDVGAYYRTADRSLTLGNFISTPGGNLSSVGSDISVFQDVMVDNPPTLTVGSRVARIINIPAATVPTEITFNYVPTVFRAEIPLGMEFDATNPNDFLVPHLADGGVLRASNLGPSDAFTRVGVAPTGQAIGNPYRWDQLGKTVVPVHPGSYQLEWPDANNPSKTYKIEIVAAYPGDSAPLASARETLLPDGNSTREVVASAFVFNTTMPRVDEEFPGSLPAPGQDAHYRHLYDPIPARNMPTKLDISTTDEWSFRELTYTDQGTGAATGTDATKPFSVSGSGRSVLLFSYRPNPDETADGTLTKERLGVRVVRSAPTVVIPRTDSKLVLGQRGLQLGNGLASSGGAFGVVQTGGSPATTTITSGDKFVVDFWLNAKGVRTSAPVTLTNCTTVAGSTTLVCASTAGIVPGMSLAGTNIPNGAKVSSVASSTSLVMSAAATGGNTGLSIIASNKPVTILSTAGGGLKVVLDPKASTITASYRGVPVTHSLPLAGATWRHHAIHVFTARLFGRSITVVDYYLDGVRKEQSFPTSWFPGTADSSVASSIDANSLRLGVDADPLHGLAIDQFRFFNLASDIKGYLSGRELRALRTERDMLPAEKRLRSTAPQLWFSFEGAPAGGRFANLGTLPNVGLGPVTGSGSYVGTWAITDLQEVATRIDSTLDNAGFAGSGYILNAVSNYNATLYNRSAEVGTWGPVFPVNHSQLFNDAARRLQISYYENPYRTDRALNPNVAWPYITTEFQNVVYPTVGPDKDKRIYIASRIGSEGVDENGRPQPVFDLAGYSGLRIYNQPNPGSAGYNPNEEHALAAPSGRAALLVKSAGDGVPNNLPLAAFALQADANQTTTPYTSEPWVLVQVDNITTGEPEMAAYAVRKTRSGSIAFPRPTDAVVQSTPGLAYEAAPKPEDRFLTLDPNRSYNFSYTFEYPVFAGDLLIPPYPLNLVIGNVSMQDERGGNIQVGGVNRRTLWRDVNKKAWVVSGDGRFFNQFFYPMRGDFFLPTAPPNGTPVAWLPDTPVFTGVGTTLEPVRVIYSSRWRSDYPKLKRGETLTYQGGEYFNENPGSNGLPALVAMKAAEIVYDSSTPDMVIGAATSAEVAKASAQIIRPLDRREKTGFTTAQMAAAGFSPAETAKLLIIAERWYFKELAGSLGKRFYYDSLASTLVFRGYLNDKDSGNPDLTAGPDPLNLLEPNVMTLDEYKAIRALSENTSWQSAIDDIFKLSQNPNGVTTPAASVTSPVFLQGVKPAPAGGGLPEVKRFWRSDLSGTVNSPDPVLNRLDSFGVGSALVPNASLLTQNPNGSLYVTIAENNRSELNGAAISLHIIEIVPDRYRGAIKVVESSDAFSEKVMLTHNGDFGSNTGDIYYEWWIRDAAPLDLVATEFLPNGNLAETNSSGQTLWQQYLPASRINDGTLTETQKHLGLNSVIFEGRPDVTLADKLVVVRYRHRNESGWNLIPFEFANPSQTWRPGTPAPFQWAGAANSPQLQADGSKRYVPQLVMGWVKRVLDRINPYEARYTDFFSNESPATYTSQIQIAGGPFAGKVALNSDKNVIENTGLIELYETVLQRARELSIDNSSNPVSTDGINQALLLAATRLSVLYEILAREAYSDAQDSTITVSDDGGLTNVASYTHAFQNFEPDLMSEELSLLRGTDFRKSYPVYNRMFWNYAKGLGEAAYNVNYNIYDANEDGFINESDARKLFPQGHGDAWGHFVNALGKHYDLLTATNFTWRTRSELYSLLQNVLEVDYLDEKSFAKLAAAKARAGRDIVRGTYRQKYTQNPDGQWQGYGDAADPARAWGVSEWGTRAGQAAYFDWAVANALLPEDATAATPIANPEGLDRIERSGAIDEVGEIAASLLEIQMAIDEADHGVNPLGFDSNAITFDVEPDLIGNVAGDNRMSHFEQIFERATVAGNNALATLSFAAQAENKLRRIADDTDELIREAMRQDLDYRNRLIEIFGRPYTGTIGFGKAYPEGYEGPDNLLFAYLDRNSVEQIIPTGTGSNNPATLDFSEIKTAVAGLSSKKALVDLYKSTSGGNSQLTNAVKVFIDGNEYEDPTVSFSMPVTKTSDYAFRSLPEWGQRTSYGRLQQILEDMLREEVALKRDIYAYTDYLGDFEVQTRLLLNQIELINDKENLQDSITGVRAGFNSTFVAVETVLGTLEIIGNLTGSIADAVKEALPTSVGFSNDVLAPARGAALAAAVAVREPLNVARDIQSIAVQIAELVRDEVIDSLERKQTRVDYVSELEGMLVEVGAIAGEDYTLRTAIGERLQTLQILRQEYYTAQAEGFRLLREREAFNKTLAATVQKNRYQDMVFRLSRNEAMSKYQSAFNNAARYTWLAAKAYDYETSLDPGHPASAAAVYDRIVKERQLGLWTDGQPAVGQKGLAEILAQMNGNFQVLKGQLGINTPESETEKISMRSEFFRIGPGPANGGSAASDDRWEDALKARIVPDLNKMPEFVRHCRPLGTSSNSAQPGLVIRFSTSIEPGMNVFGRPMLAGDHSYSSANFATKISGFGVWLDNYNAAGLATTPRAYLVPIGHDYLRESSATNPFIRVWSVTEQRIPTPFVLNESGITSPGFIPTLNGVDGKYGELRRHGDFRVYHNNGDPDADESELTLSSRLIGRSVWNSDWMLVIPGAGLHADPLTGVTRLAETIEDIKLHFQTYSHQGQ
jgi:hypothetical protein